MTVVGWIGPVKPKQRVLIHGGAGGVGHFAVQRAKAKGAEVITTVSGTAVEFARELGADVMIDYRRRPLHLQVHRGRTRRPDLGTEQSR